MAKLLDTVPTYILGHGVYNAKSRMFVEEISTMTDGGRRPLASQLYRVLNTEGFILTSPKTGTNMVFMFSHTEMQGEDVGVYVFKPTPDTLRDHPDANGVEFHVLNT